jgi:hypothetical protein
MHLLAERFVFEGGVMMGISERGCQDLTDGTTFAFKLTNFFLSSVLHIYSQCLKSATGF